MTVDSRRGQIEIISLMRVRYFLLIRLLIILFCITNISFGQSKSAARYEIDAKRIGVNPVSKDALPRSREFLRLDSTYYVGWMYEGMYKYDRSADYLGYKNAIPSLRKAFDLLNKDYGATFRNMYSSIMYFSENVNRYQDLFMISNALKECYDNIEMPDSVMNLLDKIGSYHFRKDYFGIYYHRAWTYHRNRFLTSAKYDFLKNSVEENEKMAFQWCYKGIAFIDENKAMNDSWFGPMQSEQDKLMIYHYLALLHCYNKNYDSSEYYYQRLAEGGAISWNNYGGMQSEIGNFGNAIEYFSKDMDKSYERMLREPFYYIPELYVYAGKTKEAIKMTQQIISQNGSTPGFGWYNIALGRAYLYDGQLDSAAFALNKASNFKELHIGTTLTQQQYDFTINLLKVQLLDKEISQVKFLNKGWWYNPEDLYKIASLKVQKMMTEYAVVNQLANNPERDRLVYDLFCAEATSSFDEAWYLLKDFSPKYFQKKYEDYQRTDKRQNIQRYFKLFTAKFEWERGEEDKARKDFEWMVKSTLLDTSHEKLFLGRLYEGLAKAYAEDKQKDNAAFYTNMVMEEYPQLAPFSNLQMRMRLSTSGVQDEITKNVINTVKDCNINWQNNSTNTANASVSFVKKGDSYEAVINVISATGKPVVTNEKLVFKKTEGVGNEIALRMFGKGGGLVYNQRSLD
ncbi:MAG: tetratricopeptide repeat protein [Ilyomonas sp.]